MITENFDFTDKLKKNLGIMMGVGVLGLVGLFLFYGENHHSRLWANILTNVYYFTGISLFGMFVVAATQLAYGGWQTLMKRIFLSMAAFALIGGFLLLAILLFGIFGVHNLYEHVTHMMHEAPTGKINTKQIFFATPFWVGRVAVYATLWAFFSWYMNKFFGEGDQRDAKKYKQSKLLAAAFIVVFAVSESAVSWDMVMSQDPHWYSTLFGWYNFASYGCAGWAMAILLIIFLKSKGYLTQVNENHVHDLGKFLFGFSIFWTYLWFSQFMLQWYANLPEDTNFWVKRFSDPYFKATVFLALLINFVFPLLVIIKRDAKRNFKLIGFAAAVIIFGHYIDFFNYTHVEPNWNGNLIHEKVESEAWDSHLYSSEEGFHHEAAGEAKHEGHSATEAHAAKEEAKEVAAEPVKEEKAAEPANAEAPVAEAAKEEAKPEVVEAAVEPVKEEKKEEAAAEHTAAATAAVTEHEHKDGEKHEGHEAGAAHEGAAHGEEEAEQISYAGIGVFELMVFAGFLGLFLFMFFNNLSKRPMVPESDPYLKESTVHNI
jgi:hypothetical protein